MHRDMATSQSDTINGKGGNWTLTATPAILAIELRYLTWVVALKSEKSGFKFPCALTSCVNLGKLFHIS